MDYKSYQQYERVFNHFDHDGDGKISAQELQRCIGSLGGEFSLADAEAAMVFMDCDGDGLLSFEEFVKMAEEVGEEEKINDLKKAFRYYEEMDGGGFITPKSLKRMLSRLGESKTVDECKLMIARFDLNGDGVLHFDEFMVMMS